MKTDAATVNPPLTCRDVWFIGVLLLLTGILRIWQAETNPVDLDEPFSVFHAQMSLREIMEVLTRGNNPPLYEWLLHFWIKVFGISPLSVRFPSVLFSVLNVYVLYRLAFRFFNRRVAVLSALLMAFSNYHLFFSHEARVYPLFALLSTVSFYLFFSVLQNKASAGHLLLLMLTYLGLFFSHYFGLFVAGLQAVLLLAHGRSKANEIKRYFIALAGLGLVYGLYLPIVLNRFRESSLRGTWLRPVENLGNLFDLVFYFCNQNRSVYLLFLLLLSAAAGRIVYSLTLPSWVKRVVWFVGIPVYFFTALSIFFRLPFFWHLTTSAEYTMGFVLLPLGLYTVYILGYPKTLRTIVTGWFLVPFLFFFAVSFRMPIFLDRYLIFIMPAFYLLAALSADALFPGKKAFYAAGILVLFPVVSSFRTHISNHRYSDEIARQTKRLSLPGTKVVLCPEPYILTFAYHYSPEAFKDPQNMTGKLRQKNVFPVWGEAQLDAHVYPADRVIYIDAHAEEQSPGNGIYERLHNSHQETGKLEFPDHTVMYLFTPENE